MKLYLSQQQEGLGQRLKLQTKIARGYYSRYTSIFLIAYQDVTKFNDSWDCFE